MKKKKLTSGFTLIELITALAVFIVVMTISMNSILGAFDANRKARSLKIVASNLNLAVESMSKEMRFGKNYHCGSGGTLTAAQNCPGGGTFLSFLSSEGDQITYQLNGTRIEKRENAGSFIALTAPEISIDNLTFYTIGAGTGDTLQPKIIMSVQSHAGSGQARADFDLETLVSQRELDL